MSAAVEAVTLKIKVPSANALKTIRVESKSKVLSLRKKLAEKLEVTGIDFDAYGLFWESDSGPTWLSDGSTLKAIGIKDGETLIFKPRPLTTKFSLLSSVETPKPAPEKPAAWSSAKAGWSSARPASFYGSKSLPNATPLSPKSMSTSTLGELKISTIVAMDELDDLIESFDDFCNDEPLDETSLLPGPTSPKGALQLSPRGDKVERSPTASRARGLTSGLGREKSLSVSAEVPPNTFENQISERKKIRSFNPSATPQQQQQQQPAVVKTDKLVMVESILQDALNGIDMELELGLIRHYIESALAVINKE